MAVDVVCCFCQNEEESHQHLFFACSYSVAVWQQLMAKNRVLTMPNQLEDVLDWLRTSVSGGDLNFISSKCTLATTVYGLWQERNSRIFRAVTKGHAQVAERIINGIWDFLSSRRKMKNSTQNKYICEMRGQSDRILQSV
ncbi:uncharacterized protein LOC131301476 [Rhododendron vialii]|uniref:uncharacterized protein LOC131301476 n=1 Tax=Rhododendron vialii TaxID=182163 RepID=UPI00265D7707|nr:uncharacterized protein LOC131301476 [Rhododendron vialii]